MSHLAVFFCRPSLRNAHPDLDPDGTVNKVVTVLQGRYCKFAVNLMS